jgi:GNAT superfamily N-acetyltransferase
MLHVENMTATDFQFAANLANIMDWNMTQRDFELSLKLEPEGCFVLFDGVTRAGISTCISFGKVGWFGNLVVDPSHRNQGGGILLLQRAIRFLRNNGVETIGLYAYRDLVRFYEKVGFKSNREFSVFRGKTQACLVQDRPKRITMEDAPAVIEFDRECFLGNRKRLLEPIFLRENNEYYFSKHKDRVDGYVVSKRNDEMIEIGPLVCRSGENDLAKSLLKTVLCDLAGQEVFVCLPTANKALFGALANSGLQENFRVTRMFLGPAVAESCIYVPESLERG